MRIGTLIVFEDCDRIARVPVSQFERLYKGGRYAGMLQLAGQLPRCAVVLVGIVLPKPTRISHIDCPLPPFGSDDAVDPIALRQPEAFALERTGRPLGCVSEPVELFGA